LSNPADPRFFGIVIPCCVGESVYCIAAGQSGDEFDQSQVAGEAEPLAEKGGLSTLTTSSRINELAGCDVMFETLGDVTRSEIRRAMRQIGDNQPVGPWFHEQFAGKVCVRPQYQDRGGHEFSKTFRAAGR